MMPEGIYKLWDQFGFDLPAAPPDAWRTYDVNDPEPYYFDFDWLSSRHPDAYHKFGLSTDGIMQELERLVDLSNLEVADIGAGTGRSAIGAARKAKKVVAIDIFKSVVSFGAKAVRDAGFENVTYLRGDRAHLPLRDSCVDAVIAVWAEPDYWEAYRVLRPDGYLILGGGYVPGSGRGELTAVLKQESLEQETEVAPSAWFDPHCPSKDWIGDESSLGNIPLLDGVHFRDFTHVSDYGDVQEAAALAQRFWGPLAGQYLRERNQSTIASRLRIYYGQVKK